MSNRKTSSAKTPLLPLEISKAVTRSDTAKVILPAASKSRGQAPITVSKNQTFRLKLFRGERSTTYRRMFSRCGCLFTEPITGCRVVNGFSLALINWMPHETNSAVGSRNSRCFIRQTWQKRAGEETANRVTQERDRECAPLAVNHGAHERENRVVTISPAPAVSEPHASQRLPPRGDACPRNNHCADDK
jgi:hypothetical protein